LVEGSLKVTAVWDIDDRETAGRIDCGRGCNRNQQRRGDDDGEQIAEGRQGRDLLAVATERRAGHGFRAAFIWVAFEDANLYRE